MQNQIPPTVHIVANSFPDAWYKAVKECMNNGALIKREYGKPVNTKSIISLIEINEPLQEPMLHSSFPTKELHLNEYIKQFERGYDWKAQGFEYSYIDRLVNYPTTDIYSRDDGYFKVERKPYTKAIDQIKVIRDKIAERIKKGGECLVSNREQAITWVPERDLFIKEDQPCLQRAQFFIYSFPVIEGDKIIPGKGEFHVSWRSRDLYAAWNSNMIALTKFLDKEIFSINNLKIIRVVDFCSSLHIYQSDWESAEKVKPPNINLYTARLSYEL
jgi:thymidylate synthase